MNLAHDCNSLAEFVLGNGVCSGSIAVYPAPGNFAFYVLYDSSTTTVSRRQNIKLPCIHSVHHRFLSTGNIFLCSTKLNLSLDAGCRYIPLANFHPLYSQGPFLAVSWESTRLNKFIVVLHTI